MEESRKHYDAPATEVVELKTEGLICLSDPTDDLTIKGFGDAFEI